MTDSSTGGYISPAENILDDDALDDVFIIAARSITGVASDFVRPRFQDEPDDFPELTQDWIAIGVVEIAPDTYAAMEHNPTLGPSDGHGGHTGATVQTSYETVSVLASLYGPNMQRIGRVLARGFLIPQNNEAIAANGLVFTKAEDPIKAPSMIKGRWRRKIDVMLRFRREVALTYPIRTIAAVSGQITTDHVQETFSTP